MPTGIELSAGIVVGAAKPIDAKFGPYATTAAALADIPAALRYKGLTVGIETSGQVAEYWFRSGTADSDFVLKNSSLITGSGVASMEVVTALPATPSPTTFYIVIPSGATTASAVTLGSVSLLTGGGSGGGGGGGETNFTPTSIPGLRLWLDASDTSTLFDATSGGGVVTADGAEIARWQDKSINSYNAIQTTQNQRPILKQNIQNSKSILRFDGANDCLVVPSFVMNINITMFVAGYFGSSKPLWLEHDNSFFLSGAITGWYFRRGSIVHSSRLPADWFAEIPAIASCSYDGTPASVRKNGVSVPNSLVEGSAPQNTSANQNFNICSRGQTQFFSKGDFYEILIYNGALTSSQIQQVESYLGTKWGIAI